MKYLTINKINKILKSLIILFIFFFLTIISPATNYFDSRLENRIPTFNSTCAYSEDEAIDKLNKLKVTNIEIRTEYLTYTEPLRCLNKIQGSSKIQNADANLIQEEISEIVLIKKTASNKFLIGKAIYVFFSLLILNIIFLSLVNNKELKRIIDQYSNSYISSLLKYISLITDLFLLLLLIVSFFRPFWTEPIVYLLVLKLSFNKSKSINFEKFIFLSNYINLSLILFFISVFILRIINIWNYLPFSMLATDNMLTQITARRRSELSISNFMSAYNHHTTVVNEFNSIGNLITNFFFGGGHYYLYGHYTFLVIISILSSYLLFRILSILNINLFLKITSSFIFLIMQTSSTIETAIIKNDVRTYEIFFILITLYYFYTCLENKKYQYHFGFFSFLTIYNLETSVISSFLLFLLFFLLNELSFNNIKKYIFGFGSSLLLIFTQLLITNDLVRVINYNYIFHLKMTNKLSSDLTGALGLVELGYRTSRYFSVYNFIFIICVLYIILNFRKILKPKTNYVEIALYLILAGQYVALNIAGPRFVHYGQSMKVPYFILFTLILNKCLNLVIPKLRPLMFILIFALFPIILPTYFYGSISDSETLYRNKNVTTPEQVEVANLLNKNNAEIILSWVPVKDYFWLYFENNFLPATRYWWWFDMKWSSVDYYNWDGFWFENEVLDLAYQDIKSENANFAVINKDFSFNPTFNTLLKYYKLVECTENYCVYELNSQ